MNNFEDRVDKLRRSIILGTQELVNIKSVKEDGQKNAPFGPGIRKCLDRTLELCEELGFKTKDLDGYAGFCEYGQGDEMVAILVHLDVVPEGTGWTVEPFQSIEKDGRLYGRGSNDDKGAAVASIYALKAIKDSGIQMNKRFRIIFGCDEESGWDCMDYYLKNEEMPSCGFSPDGPFPIVNREKGILRIHLNKKMNIENNRIISLNGGQRPNMVPESCQCTIKANNQIIEDIKNYKEDNKDDKFEINIQDDLVHLKAFGLSAHGSEPYLGKNAVIKMLKLLNGIEDLDSSQGEFINFIVKYIGDELYGKSLDINHNDELSGDLTLNLGIFNLDEVQAKATLDIRYPVTAKGEHIINKIKEKADKYSIDVEVMEDKAPLYVSEDNPLIEKLSRAYETVMNEKAQLISLNGGTYSRAIKNCVAFGPLMPNKEDTAHQKDEYIEVEDLINSAKIYAQAIYELNKN